MGLYLSTVVAFFGPATAPTRDTFQAPVKRTSGVTLTSSEVYAAVVIQ